MSVEIVAQNLCKGLGEGPHWETSTGKVLLVDVTERVIYKFQSGTGQIESRQMAEAASYLIPSTSGGYITTQGKKFCHYDYGNDVLTTLHEVEPGQPSTLNDGKCDASGRLWTGTIPATSEKDPVPQNEGDLYTLETDGSLRARVHDIALSNGLAWTADNTIMYHADTLKREIFAYDFDLQSGDATNRRVVKTFETGVPDGMSIDTEGKLWVAIYSFGIVQRIDPETGAILQSIELPRATTATSCCFGGENLQDLYITTSAQGGGIRDNTNGGSLFKVTGLGVQGQPVPIYGSA